VIPTNAAPITFYLRDSAAWLDHALREQAVEETKLAKSLTPNALRIWEHQKRKGACFAEEIERSLGLSSIEVQYALWELASAGLAAADGFDQLRSMINPERRRAANSSYRRVRSAAGRWSLFRSNAPTPEDAIEQARFNDIAIESSARMLLNRYGVVFRDLLVLESNIPRWGILMRMLRRLEDRGEVRGGRFVSGFGGEQFALPEVPESLRSSRIRELQGDVTVAGADPVNLIGILIPGERAHAVPGRSFVITNDMLERAASTISQEANRPRYRENIQYQPSRRRQTGAAQTAFF
jgi:ATP-dependent Lhr-like helicase